MDIKRGTEMGFFRNPEISKTALIWGLLSAAAVAAAFAAGPGAGIAVLALCLAYSAAHFIITYRRYKNIARLSSEVDRVLHGDTTLELSEFDEGELNILSSEIHKMTLRLREQADRLAADKEYLADSIADISHQIRTPLTSVSLLTEFLSEPELDTERRIKYVKELFELLDRIDWLINTLLKMSKFDAGTVYFDRRKENIPKLVKRAYEPIAIPMELRGQSFVMRIPEDMSLDCDVRWTVEAVENILKNCMEHTPRGGTVSVAGEYNAVYSMITIRDTGYGIAKEDLPNIFKRFYKGKDSSSGSVGIGLALARMIINGQGGRIKAYNGSDGGAVFEIKFYKSVV